MKKSSKIKAFSSTTNSTDLEMFSSYSHEQVHIYDKLCSSISSICQIAYCTSEGIHICVPQTYIRQSSTATISSSSSSASMLISRIKYPFESSDQTNSISSNSSSLLFFEKIKTKLLPNLYQAYKLRPTSLSSFDRLLSNDLVQYKGFRQCLFSPFDITLNHGQSILATISCAHEVFIYEIVSTSKRFFQSESANLIFDLTKILFENKQYENLFEDSRDEINYRLLYSHLTSKILWNNTGKYLFQLQYSGHLIVWIFDGLKLVNEQSLKIIDTKISKPLTMIWNENQQILIVIGKENQRILIRIDQIKVMEIKLNNDENDFMNVEHCELIEIDQENFFLIESKINYCLISQIHLQENESTIQQLDSRIFSSPIIGLEKQHSNPNSLLIGCEDGSIHSLQLPLVPNVDCQQLVSNQIKTCLRKPLLLRHFNLSFNEYLLVRIFYSPIISPNVKFGFVLCLVHRWNTYSFDELIEHFLNNTEQTISSSTDQLAVILQEILRHRFHHYQLKNTNISNENQFSSLQRQCRLNYLLNNTKQLFHIENQFLQIYRQRLSSILSKISTKFSPIELAIYSICTKNEIYSSRILFSCPLCNCLLNLTSTDLLVATCENQHSWPRCSKSLLPLMIESSRICSLCDRTMNSLENLTHFLKYKDTDLQFFFSSLCTFCLSK